MITAAVIARDEESNIVACLETLAWADERLVLDGGSSDLTVDLSRQAGARAEQRPFDDFPRQRNAAMALAEHDWVLFVDADERVTSELAAEVRQTVEHAEHDGYFVPRFNHILGKVIRHTGWYPDYQMRLLDRRHARYDEDVPVHEVVELDGGEPGYLREHLVHYNYQTLGQFFRKQESYSDFEASQLLAGGPVRARSLLSMPIREFARRYWQLQGYRDGGHGLLLSLLMAYFTFRRYQKCFS
ncbi:MAG TPA: glycosyltransferase family 2 protein [Chloroflexota bacterium]|nr:glycosyltransferase family 2 protein [Chloroflexota bacterium]